MTKEVKEIFDVMCNFEMEMGESFNDYFSHDNVADNSWAFFLLGKGHTKHANHIIGEILRGETCIDQEELYDVKSYDDDNVGGDWEFNMELMAEFLSSSDYYRDKFLTWIKEFEG